MSDGAKLQLQYDALVSRFVLPLVKGGEARVTQPIAPAAIAYLQHSSCTDGVSDAAVFDALHRSASAIAHVESVPWPDRDLILIAMAAHNLVWATDPTLERAFGRGARRKVVGWIWEIIAAVEAPDTRSAALARHAMVEPLLELTRRDLTAKSWAYTYRFRGRSVDGNLLTRPLFGRGFDLTEERPTLASLLAEIDDEHDLELVTLFRHLIARSPVTELASLERWDGLRFGAASLATLSDPEIRGGLARLLATHFGVDPQLFSLTELVNPGGSFSLIARSLGQALSDASLKTIPPSLLRGALDFCFEIHSTVLLDHEGPATRQSAEALEDPKIALFAAILAQGLEVGDRWTNGSFFSARDQALLKERSELLRKLIPATVLRKARSLWNHAVPPVDETLSPPTSPEVRP